MFQKTDFLVIGAGPFGLAAAALAKHEGLNYVLLGKPMDFWKENMPEGMYLRSSWDWHLDPLNTDTIEAYLDLNKMAKNDVEPLPLSFYLKYTSWFQEQKQIEPYPHMVKSLTRGADTVYPFEAELENGGKITAKKVLLALGFRYFKNIPQEYTEMFSTDYITHTCDHVDFSDLVNKRCMIIGGRQSAFEWAALLQEAGAGEIHVAHRHDTPEFVDADWSWVNAVVDRIADHPGWFRNLSAAEKEKVNHQLWSEGRLKVEPWLWPRVNKDNVYIRPNTTVTQCDMSKTGQLTATLNNEERLEIDHIILATGYQVDMKRVPFLAKGGMLKDLKIKNGFPVLDEAFQSNIPGLYITSLPATQDFGPFFGFTISVRTSAKLVVGSLVGA